jgi:hypothetical protein
MAGGYLELGDSAAILIPAITASANFSSHLSKSTRLSELEKIASADLANERNREIDSKMPIRERREMFALANESSICV